MSIATKIDDVATKLQIVRVATVLIEANNFEDATVEDMKANAKDICDDAKGYIDDIKDLIDEWS